MMKKDTFADGARHGRMFACSEILEQIKWIERRLINEGVTFDDDEYMGMFDSYTILSDLKKTCYMIAPDLKPKER